MNISIVAGNSSGYRVLISWTGTNSDQVFIHLKLNFNPYCIAFCSCCETEITLAFLTSHALLCWRKSSNVAKATVATYSYKDTIDILIHVCAYTQTHIIYDILKLFLFTGMNTTNSPLHPVIIKLMILGMHW